MREGKKNKSQLPYYTPFGVHRCLRGTKQQSCQHLRPSDFPKINGMQVNRRLSSELQPVAFNFPSDRKIVCSVRLCPLCKNLRAGRLDEWFHLLQFFYLWYILYKIITKSKTREVQWKQCWYMLDFQGLQNTKNNRKLLILQKTSHFSAVILRIHLHTNKEELFSLNIHLRMPDKNSLKP